jgi:hypothetical protein
MSPPQLQLERKTLSDVAHSKRFESMRLFIIDLRACLRWYRAQRDDVIRAVKQLANLIARFLKLATSEVAHEASTLDSKHGEATALITRLCARLE